MLPAVPTEPKQPAPPNEERIGKYRVHPVASMFPLLEGDAYDDLKNSIEIYGQQRPIVMQGDILIDGRNRLRVCLEIGMPPRFVEYNSELDPADYIRIANMDRRHLTADMQAAIATEIYLWKKAQTAAAKQAAARAEQGHHGVEGGRGHQKDNKALDANSHPRLSGRDLKKKNADSTIGQIAAEAKVTEHKARQAVTIAQTINRAEAGKIPRDRVKPDLLRQVANGKVKLKDAYAQVKVTPPRDPEKPRKADAFDVEKKAEACQRKMSAWIALCPSGKRSQFKELLLKECQRLCEK